MAGANGSTKRPPSRLRHNRLLLAPVGVPGRLDRQVAETRRRCASPRRTEVCGVAPGAACATLVTFACRRTAGHRAYFVGRLLTR